MVGWSTSGSADRARAGRLWHAQPKADEGGAAYKKTGNLRACQLLLGHTKLESTVRYVGVEVDDALELSEALEL